MRAHLHDQVEGAPNPLLRLCWNKKEDNYLATMKMNASEIVILDVRSPCQPLATLGKRTRVKLRLSALGRLTDVAFFCCRQPTVF